MAEALFIQISDSQLNRIRADGNRIVAAGLKIESHRAACADSIR